MHGLSLHTEIWALKINYLGNEVPKEDLIWQDPISKNKYKLKNKDIEYLKSKISKSGISISQLVSTAWASASTFRASDKRGGANGARVTLAPQKDWKVNNPSQLSKVIKLYEKIQKAFNSKKKHVSLADLIILGGNVGVEKQQPQLEKKLNYLFPLEEVMHPRIKLTFTLLVFRATS